MTKSCACGAGRDRSCRRLLAFLGAAVVATGQPVDEVEDELRDVGRHLGAPDVQVGAGPTGVHVGLASGDPATFESVDGRLRLDQAADVRLIRHLLVVGRIDVEQAVDRLQGLRGKPMRYPVWLAEGGFVAVAVGICLILQPGPTNLAAAAVGGVIVMGLSRAAQWHPSLLALLPTVAAFAVSAPVFAAAAAGLLDGALRTVLPPLAVLRPGALIQPPLYGVSSGWPVCRSGRRGGAGGGRAVERAARAAARRLAPSWRRARQHPSGTRAVEQAMRAVGVQRLEGGVHPCDW